MALLKLTAIAALGYVGYRAYEKQKNKSSPAYADGQGTGGVRDAGPSAMRDSDGKSWTETDQEGDESFPASDPPANY